MRRLLLVVGVVAALAALFVFGLFSASPDRNVPSNLINKPAPDFDLSLYPRYHDTHSTELSLSSLLGTPMLVNFWASWCIPCYEEAPLLEKYYRRYHDQGVEFIGIQTQDRDKYAEGDAFLDRFDISFPNGMDNDSRIGVDYALFGVPETYFVDAKGTVVFKQIGPVTAEVLDRELTRLLQ